MCYYASGFDSEMVIPRKDIPQLLSCIRRKYDIPEPQDEDRDIEDEFMDVLSHLGYGSVMSEGNITGIYYGHKEFDEDEVMGFLNIILPFVKKGSYMTFVGDDHCFWAYFFGDNSIEKHDGKVVFPGMPINDPENENSEQHRLASYLKRMLAC